MEALDIADALMVALNFWHGHGGDSLAADRSGSETELVDGPVSGSQQEVLTLSRLTPLEQMCAVSGAIAHATVRERSCLLVQHPGLRGHHARCKDPCP